MSNKLTVAQGARAKKIHACTTPTFQCHLLHSWTWIPCLSTACLLRSPLALNARLKTL